jgi:hypothetical protein
MAYIVSAVQLLKGFIATLPLLRASHEEIFNVVDTRKLRRVRVGVDVGRTFL